MNLPRRQFLYKSFAGFLSFSLLTPAYSVIKTLDGSSFSVNHLFSQLSFNKAFLSKYKLNKIFGSAEKEGLEKSIRTERILHADKTICIPGLNDLISQRDEYIVHVHQKTLDGFQPVLSLNQWELHALQSMLTVLKRNHGISDSNELKTLLIPILKTKNHLPDEKIVEGDRSSRYGYYTAHGYCSIRILAKGNRMNISTSLRNHRKIVTHRNSFELNGIA